MIGLIRLLTFTTPKPKNNQKYLRSFFKLTIFPTEVNKKDDQ